METEKEIESKDPKQIKMLFWSVFAGSKGCINRVKIVLQLKQTPLNAVQLPCNLISIVRIVDLYLGGYALILKQFLLC